MTRPVSREINIRQGYLDALLLHVYNGVSRASLHRYQIDMQSSADHTGNSVTRVKQNALKWGGADTTICALQPLRIESSGALTEFATCLAHISDQLLQPIVRDKSRVDLRIDNEPGRTLNA